MSFVKRTIKDRIVTPAKRYKLTKVVGTDDIYDLEQQGNVTEIGTPTNAELLQRYEDTLDEHETAIGNKLNKTGDSKDNTVTFIETTADADIITGESHATLFGKIKKRFSTIATSIASINTALSGKASNSHASTATTYGLGTTVNYGHVKTINALTQTSHIDGTVLSAYQGYLINSNIANLLANAFDLYYSGTINFLSSDEANTPIKVAEISLKSNKFGIIVVGFSSTLFIIDTKSNKTILYAGQYSGTFNSSSPETPLGSVAVPVSFRVGDKLYFTVASAGSSGYTYWSISIYYNSTTDKLEIWKARGQTTQGTAQSYNYNMRLAGIAI